MKKIRDSNYFGDFGDVCKKIVVIDELFIESKIFTNFAANL